MYVSFDRIQLSCHCIVVRMRFCIGSQMIAVNRCICVRLDILVSSDRISYPLNSFLFARRINIFHLCIHSRCSRLFQKLVVFVQWPVHCNNGIAGMVAISVDQSRESGLVTQIDPDLLARNLGTCASQQEHRRDLSGWIFCLTLRNV